MEELLSVPVLGPSVFLAVVGGILVAIAHDSKTQHVKMVIQGVALLLFVVAAMNLLVRVLMWLR